MIELGRTAVGWWRGQSLAARIALVAGAAAVVMAI